MKDDNLPGCFFPLVILIEKVVTESILVGTDHGEHERERHDCQLFLIWPKLGGLGTADRDGVKRWLENKPSSFFELLLGLIHDNHARITTPGVAIKSSSALCVNFSRSKRPAKHPQQGTNAISNYASPVQSITFVCKQPPSILPAAESAEQAR
jgi:hypothetical protein